MLFYYGLNKLCGQQNDLLNIYLLTRAIMLVVKKCISIQEQTSFNLLTFTASCLQKKRPL